MRHVEIRLHRFLKPSAADEIHHQREDDGQREPHAQRNTAKGARCCHGAAKIEGLKEGDEMGEPHPCAAPNASRGK